MLNRHRRQNPPTLRGSRLLLPAACAVGLSALFFFISQGLEEAASATIILVPATGLLWVVRVRRWEHRQWERLRQKIRNRGEERASGNAKSAIAEPRPWWEVLEISERSTFEDVKAAYRAKIKECHPDKVMGLAREFQELADRKTKEINRIRAGADRAHQIAT
jgi:DnaJ domain